jgi:hypothetical protein
VVILLRLLVRSSWFVVIKCSGLGGELLTMNHEPITKRAGVTQLVESSR